MEHLVIGFAIFFLAYILGVIASGFWFDYKDRQLEKKRQADFERKIESLQAASPNERNYVDKGQS